MTTQDTDNKILILGAGITGLSLARGLQKNSIPFTLYEANPSITTRRNWTFGLHWGIHALKELLPVENFFTRLKECQVDPNVDIDGDEALWRLPLINGETGERIKFLDSEKFYRLRRDKVRKWLAEGVDVRWGKEVVSINCEEHGQSVTVFFADGTQDSGRMIVGADGAHSAVRRFLVGDERSQLTPVGDFATAMCASQHTRDHALWLRSPPHHPLYQVATHPAGHVAWLSVHDAEDKEHPENWTFFHYISYRAPTSHSTYTSAELVQHQQTLARTFYEPWRSLYSWTTPEDCTAWYTKMQNWDPSLAENSWDNPGGRVTLAGDAAHPMSFQRGQGLNNALQDAVELCRSIVRFWTGDEGEQGDVVDEYERGMKARGGKEVKTSAATTFALHDFEKLMGSPLVKQGLKGGA